MISLCWWWSDNLKLLFYVEYNCLLTFILLLTLSSIIKLFIGDISWRWIFRLVIYVIDFWLFYIYCVFYISVLQKLSCFLLYSINKIQSIKIQKYLLYSLIFQPIICRFTILNIIFLTLFILLIRKLLILKLNLAWFHLILKILKKYLFIWRVRFFRLELIEFRLFES